MATFKWKLKLATLRLRRVDDAEEDDFKTWALTTVSTSSDAPTALWYRDPDVASPPSADANANLGKTSVTNGLEAAYNFSRGSPVIELTDARVGELADGILTISVFRGGKRHSKEDVLIGTVAIPLKPLIDGKEIAGTFDLIPPVDTSANASNAYVGAMDVHVSGDAALETYCRGGRTLSVSKASLFALPSQWVPEPPPDGGNEALLTVSKDVTQPAFSYKYVLAVTVPGTESDQIIAASGGVVKLVARSTFDGSIAVATGDEPAGTVTYEWRVLFQAQPSAFLSATAVNKLVVSMESGCSLSVLLKRIATAPSEIVPGTIEETEEDFLGRGVSQITLEDLLSPGNTLSVGEYSVSAGEVSEEDMAAAAAAKEAREAAIAKAKGGKPGGKPAAKPAPAAAKGKPGAPVPDAPKEVNVLSSSGTVLSVSLVLDEPIVLRPPSPPQSVLTIDDLVAPRPKALTSPPGVTCTQQFQEDVAFIVHGIAEQYGKILKDASVGGSDADAKRKALMTALNTSGQYHAMKERLKRSAVRIVRERFHKTELQTEDEYVAAKDAFLADLYTYLIGQAHRAMHDAFEEAATGAAITRAGSVKGSITAAIMSSASKPDSRVAVSESKDAPDESDRIASLGRIAQEAEHTGDYSKASNCLQTRIALHEKLCAKGLSPKGYRADLWHDYGAFCVRRGDATKGIECLREAVAIQRDYVPSLQLLGALLASQGDYSAAVLLVSSAIAAVGSDSLAVSLLQAILALIHEKTGDVSAAAAAVQAAVLAFRASGANLIKPIVGNSTVDTAVAPSEPYLLAADYLLSAKVLDMAEAALVRASCCIAEQDVPKDVRISLLVNEARLAMTRGPAMIPNALSTLEGALEYDRVNKSAWRIKGDVLSKAGEALTAVKTAYEFAVGDWNKECDDVTLLLKLAAVYIGLRDESLYGSAKEIALRAAKVSDWSIAWLLAGQAAYLAGQMDQAEAALNQANISDNTNAEVWAWLALICLEGEAPRVKESMQALDQALLLNLSIRTNTEVLMELAASYSGVGKEQVTEKILQRLMTATDDAHVKLCLAESLARQHKLDDAQPLFREVLKLCDGDDAKAAAAGLALVTEQLGDKSEASRIRAQYRV